MVYLFLSFIISACFSNNSVKEVDDLEFFVKNFGKIKFKIDSGENYFLEENLQYFEVSIPEKYSYNFLSMSVLEDDGELEFNQYREGRVKAYAGIDSLHIVLALSMTDSISKTIGIFPIEVRSR